MRIATIVARYGPEIVGGAERLARGFCEELCAQGHAVEVWTSCAGDYQDWLNVYQPGVEVIQGVSVRRFPVDEWHPDIHIQLTAKLLKHGRLPSSEQYEWFYSGPTSQALYAYIADHAGAFDAFVVIPYISTLTYLAAWIAPEKVILWPCLHDEIFAYLQPVRLLMETVRGVVFNSPEERDLAQHDLKMRPAAQIVLGSGVSGEKSAIQFNLTGVPYLLYVGRMDKGKNLELLVEYIMRCWSDGQQIRLITAGLGPFDLPEHPAFAAKGFVTDQQKADLYAGALALCQPSIKESFSLTIMESWLAGRPVLVHAQCPVTRGHVERSSGGLWFESYGEFYGALHWFQNNPEGARRLGENGRAYVGRNYSWPAIVQRFIATFEPRPGSI